MKIPTERFDAYAQWMLDTFDVKDSNFGFYRTDLTLQQNQVKILLETLEIYDSLLTRLKAEEPATENIEAIADITQKKLDVAQQLGYYGFYLEQEEKKVTYATLYITIVQNKPVDYVPEDVGRGFQIKVREAVSVLTGTAGGILVVLATVAKYIIYAFAVVIPVSVAYRRLSRIWNKTRK